MGKGLKEKLLEIHCAIVSVIGDGERRQSSELQRRLLQIHSLIPPIIAEVSEIEQNLQNSLSRFNDYFESLHKDVRRTAATLRVKIKNSDDAPYFKPDDVAVIYHGGLPEEGDICVMIANGKPFFRRFEFVDFHVFRMSQVSNRSYQEEYHHYAQDVPKYFGRVIAIERDSKSFNIRTLEKEQDERVRLIIEGESTLVMQ